jgi:hypothetical protein
VVGGRISGYPTVAGARLDPTLERVLAASWDIKDYLRDPTVVGNSNVFLASTWEPTIWTKGMKPST